MTEEQIQETAKQVYESWKKRGLYLINVEYLIRALVAEGREKGIDELWDALLRDALLTNETRKGIKIIAEQLKEKGKG